MTLNWQPQHWRERGSYAEVGEAFYAISPIMEWWQVEYRTKDGRCDVLEFFSLEGMGQAYVERIVAEKSVADGWKTG